MEKMEAVNRLKKAGYQVQFDSSIVTVLLSAGVNRNQELKRLRAFFQEIGYDASFGLRQAKESILEKEVFQVEEEGQTEGTIQGEETQVEVGEQFSLEDFGIG